MKQRAFLGLVLAGMIAGTTGLLIKNIELNARAIAWLRMGLPTILLGLYIVIKKITLVKKGYKSMLIASLLNALRLYLYILAFVLTTLANATILFYTWPIFAAILGHYFLKEKIIPFHLLLIFISFSGLVVAFSDHTWSLQDQDLLGIISSLTAAFFYAITVIIFKSKVLDFGRVEMIFYQNLVGAVVFLPFFLMVIPEFTLTDLAYGGAYAIIIGMFVFYLFFFGLKYLRAYIASAVMYLEVISAVMLGYLFLGESLTPRMLIGGSMIIISSFLLNQSK